MKCISLFLKSCAAVIMGAQLAAAADVSIDVDWSTVARKLPANGWSVNVPSFMDPRATADSTWLNLVNEITAAKPIVRIHGWGMITPGSPENWLNADKTWNGSKICAALRPAINAGNDLLINIPDGPNTGSTPDPDLIGNPDKIAAWVASLVKIVNIDCGLQVKYWELPNEREAGFQAGGLTANQMAVLLSKASRAMKAVDPTIKVGGPATAWINNDYLQQTVRGCLSDIDFVTAHIYPGGSDYSSDTMAKRYDSAQKSVFASLQTLRAGLSSISPSRYLPIYVTEYNISWEYSPGSINFDNQGAVFDALLATSAIKAGADGTHFWNVGYGSSWMSLIQTGNTRYPMSNYLSLLNRFFDGQMPSATTSNPSLIDVFAARNTLGSLAVMLINRSFSPQTASLNFSGALPSSVEMYVIDSNGYRGPVGTAFPFNSGLAMPAQSIVVLVAGSSGSPGPTPTPTEDTIAPTITLTSPANESTIRAGSHILATAKASDNVSVAKVEFYVNGRLRCTVTNAPYRCSLTTSKRRNRTYAVQALAYDQAGNVGKSQISRVVGK